jgi:hypothetical protein
VTGNGYNTYQLDVNAGETAASLWVDGTEVATGYTGNTSFVVDRGLEFAAFSGGQGNFNMESLSIPVGVPEPTTLALASLGMLSLRSMRSKLLRRGRSSAC